jgi:hypothetical protein
MCGPRSFASHPKAKYWSDKNEIEPEYVMKYSNKKFKFDCEDCHHEIEMQLCNITNGQWCIYCNFNKLCDADDCLFCFQKSFASHAMAEQWSPKNEKTARQVTRSSEKKCWFDCATCKHSFQSALYSIKNDNYCPYCTSQALCDSDECTTCFEKSCASHVIKDAWSPLNEKTPRQMFLQSNKKAKFCCQVCTHNYETTITHFYNRNGSCPYCSNKYLCEDTACHTCFQKSFAAHEKIHCWSAKNTVDPRSVFKGSETRCTFDCDVCHSEFEARLYNVLTGYWCPFCKNKSEAKMASFLQKKYPDCKTQARFDWCRFSKTNNIMPFDFRVGDVLIELDGNQHFTQVSNWDAPENVQAKDVEKIQKAVQEGYSVIHLLQLDVWKDTYDWKKVLQATIEELHGEPHQCIFLQKDTCTEYNSHIGQLGDSVMFTLKHPE